MRLRETRATLGPLTTPQPMLLPMENREGEVELEEEKSEAPQISFPVASVAEEEDEEGLFPSTAESGGEVGSEERLARQDA